jgi:hypothetical protein
MWYARTMATEPVSITERDQSLLDATGVEFGWTGWDEKGRQCWLVLRCHLCGKAVEWVFTPQTIRRGRLRIEVNFVTVARSSAKKWGCVHVEEWAKQGGANRPVPEEVRKKKGRGHESKSSTGPTDTE